MKKRDQNDTSKKPNRTPRSYRPGAKLMTITQLEEVYGPPARTWRDWINAGALPVVRVPGSRRAWIRVADADALIDRSVEKAS